MATTSVAYLLIDFLRCELVHFDIGFDDIVSHLSQKDLSLLLELGVFRILEVHDLGQMRRRKQGSIPLGGTQGLNWLVHTCLNMGLCTLRIFRHKRLRNLVPLAQPLLILISEPARALLRMSLLLENGFLFEGQFVLVV